MADRALFIGFGAPVRGREERAVEVFNEFVDMFGRMQSDGRVASMEVSLLIRMAVTSAGSSWLGAARRSARRCRSMRSSAARVSTRV